MPFISELIIEKTAERLESVDPQTCLEAFAEEQPYLASYLDTETVDVLTTEEKDYLLFMVMVIFNSITEIIPIDKMVMETAIGQAEEANWQILTESTAKKFRDRMTPFFDNTQQEDLLAFIEDCLLDNEELTDISREPLFVVAKTFVDVLIPDEK